MYIFGRPIYNNLLHHFSFNMPLSGAKMTGFEPLLFASSMRKGVKNNNNKKRFFL
jgi:hypothetical protein